MLDKGNLSYIDQAKNTLADCGVGRKKEVNNPRFNLKSVSARTKKEKKNEVNTTFN